MLVFFIKEVKKNILRKYLKAHFKSYERNLKKKNSAYFEI